MPPEREPRIVRVHKLLREKRKRGRWWRYPLFALSFLIGGFIAVFVLMVLLFRSLLFGLASMLPLTFAIILSYGLVGLVGKDYDMPIAVCSSLALGLSIDFAIHYIQRFRARLGGERDLDAVNRYMFGEPGRAIARNALVIIFGFLPMVLATLTPYKTVGAFFALLMTFSMLTTLALLPGLLHAIGGRRARRASAADTTDGSQR